MDAERDETLPLRGNCWVMRGAGTGIQVAKVKACRRSGGKVLVDLVMFTNAGERLGRTSPAMGGPRSYEPCCDLGDWVRIEKPDFPLRMSWVDGEDGRRSPGYPGTKVIPFGRFRPAKPGPAAVKPVARNSDYDPESEAAARRLAAQELRDLARALPDAADSLKERAAKLEAEADSISPRR